MNQTYDILAEFVTACTARKSILLIDDSQDDAALFRLLLRHHYCTLTVATSGPEGIALVEKEQFNLILCDLKLPGMSGVEVIQRIKTFRRGQGIRQRVVALSSAYTPELFSQLQAVNCFVYAHKPDCFNQEYMDNLMTDVDIMEIPMSAGELVAA